MKRRVGDIEEKLSQSRKKHDEGLVIRKKVEKRLRSQVKALREKKERGTG